jgi:hypothetical protein
MSVYTKELAVVAESVAFRIVTRDTQKRFPRDGITVTEYTNIVARDSLAVAKQTRNHGILHLEYSANSCVSYALQDNRDPIACYNRAVELGHETHWVNQCASVLSATRSPQKTLVLIHDGMVVLFEGIFFTVKIHGEHVKLVKI